MARFLIDANLPYRFSLWQGPDYLHVFDLNDAWPDSEIWRYAREERLTIVKGHASCDGKRLPVQKVDRCREANDVERRLREMLARVPFDHAIAVAHNHF